MIWIFSHCFQISRKLGAALLSLELVLSIIQRGKYYVAHGFPVSRTTWTINIQNISECPVKTCRSLPIIWLWLHLLLANDVHYGNTFHRVVLLLLLWTPSIQCWLRGEEREMMRRCDVMDGHGVYHLAWHRYCVLKLHICQNTRN